MGVFNCCEATTLYEVSWQRLGMDGNFSLPPLTALTTLTWLQEHGYICPAGITIQSGCGIQLNQAASALQQAQGDLPLVIRETQLPLGVSRSVAVGGAGAWPGEGSHRRESLSALSDCCPGLCASGAALRGRERLHPEKFLDKLA